MADPIRKRDKARATYKDGNWTVTHGRAKGRGPELSDALIDLNAKLQTERVVELRYAQRRAA